MNEEIKQEEQKIEEPPKPANTKRVVGVQHRAAGEAAQFVVDEWEKLLSDRRIALLDLR